MLPVTLGFQILSLSFSMTTTTSTHSSTYSEFPHNLLRRRVSANGLINTYRQGDSQSNGMGNPHSKLIQRVSSQRPSIVDPLAARLVTAQRLQILVHQHYDYRINFEWNGGNSGSVSSRFMERRFFMYSDTQTFCIELCRKGLEGLCTCVYGDNHTFIPDKTPRCLREPFYPWQKYFLKTKWWLKSSEEGEKENLCVCSISSAEDILDWSLKNAFTSRV